MPCSVEHETFFTYKHIHKLDLYLGCLFFICVYFNHIYFKDEKELILEILKTRKSDECVDIKTSVQ